MREFLLEWLVWFGTEPNYDKRFLIDVEIFASAIGAGYLQVVRNMNRVTVNYALTEEGINFLKENEHD